MEEGELFLSQKSCFGEQRGEETERRGGDGGPQAHVRGFGQANSIKLCR